MTRARGERSKRVDFFQLIQAIQRRTYNAAEIGHLGRRGTDLQNEAVRIRPTLTLGFPARDVESVETLSQDPPQVRVDVNFGGLYGPDSPLPNAFTEELLVDDFVSGTDDLEGVRDFLDIFHHRLYSLLYRSWERHRHVATFQRDGSDEISQFIFAIAGFGTRGMEDAASAEGALPRLQALRIAGLERQRPRSAGVLRAALRDHLGEPVKIESFVRRTVEIEARDRTYLGGARVGGSRIPPRSLGGDLVLGTRLVDVSSRVRIVIGPLERSAYEGLLPGTIGRDGVDALVRRLAPVHIETEIELVLDRAEAAATRLGGEQGLGWTSWLASSPENCEERVSLFAGPV